MKNGYRTVKTVNGHEIIKRADGRGCYYIYITPKKFYPFRELEEAVNYAETLLQERG